MQIETDKEFPELRKKFTEWKTRFPMFKHDVYQIEHIIENHIQNYSIVMVQYRQTHSKACLKKAQEQIDAINRVLATVEKMELMALLAR
jgi:hypothetical protein